MELSGKAAGMLPPCASGGLRIGPRVDLSQVFPGKRHEALGVAWTCIVEQKQTMIYSESPSTQGLGSSDARANA